MYCHYISVVHYNLPFAGRMAEYLHKLSFIMILFDSKMKLSNLNERY